MKIWNVLLRLAGLIFLLLGSMLAIRDGFLIDWWQLTDLVWICVLVSVFVTLIYMHWLSGLCGVGASALLAGWMLRQYSLPLVQEAARLRDTVVPLVGRYHHLQLPPKTADWSHASYDSRYFLVLAALGLSLWLGVGVAEQKLRKLAFLLVAAAYLCGFAVGNAPGVLAIVCLVCGQGICFAVPGGDTNPVVWKTSLLTLVGLFFVLWAVAAVYQPISEEFLKNHDFYLNRQLALEDELLELTNGNELMDRLRWAFGGNDSQAALSMEPPVQGDEIVFEMTVTRPPQEPVYVKNFTGARYEDGVWSAEDGGLFYGFLKERYSEEEREGSYSKADEAELTKSYRLGNAYSVKSQRIVMDIKKREGSTTLWPYFCGIPEYAQCVGDAGIRTEARRYEAFGYPVGVQAFVKSLKTGYMEAEEEYQQYLLDHGSSLAQEAMALVGQDLQKALDALQECEYSFDLEPVPAGTDIVTDFLFRQKKGYCMHFASARTLMNQAAGIPARYASGYVVLPGDFKENPDGTYTAAVPQYRGHAWMEVYDAHLGWFPVEVTPPSYLGGLQEAGPGASPADTIEQGQQGAAQEGEEEAEEQPKEAQEEEEEEEEAEKPQPTEPEQEEEQKEEEPSVEPGQKADPGMPVVWQILAGALAAVVCLAGLVLLAALRVRRIWRRREAALTDPDTSRAALAAGNLMLGLLRIQGIRPGPQEEELSFASRVEEAAGWMEPGAFVAGMEILLAARYGQRPIPAGHRDVLTALYWRMMTETVGQMNRRQRLWYQYFHVKVKK